MAVTSTLSMAEKEHHTCPRSGGRAGRIHARAAAKRSYPAIRGQGQQPRKCQAAMVQEWQEGATPVSEARGGWEERPMSRNGGCKGTGSLEELYHVEG